MNLPRLHFSRKALRVGQPCSTRFIKGQTVVAMANRRPQLLVVAGPDTPELQVLEELNTDVDTVGIGRTVEELKHLTAEQWQSIDCMLVCGVGARAGKKEDIQEMWPRLTGIKWAHSSSAGLEKLMFPALADSSAVVSNAKGVYSHSLAEYVLTCCNYFAKDLPRMQAARVAGRWDPYEVEELRGKIFGVIGYGDIGQACGQLAKAFKMQVVALRRNPQLSEAEAESGALDAVYGADQMLDMVAKCDYLMMSTPATPATHKLFSKEAIGAMKPTAVFINVGRGKCVDEEALIDALRGGKIRGAGLDVFYEEPLPAESPLYKLDNVLMSAHCADKTADFQYQSLKFFIENMRKYVANEELMNIVDKHAGY